MVFGLGSAGGAGCGRGGNGAAVLVTAACVLEPVAPNATGTTRSKGRGGLKDGAEEIGRGWRALGKLTLNCYQFWTVCH